MQVILKDDVPSLGDAGTVVKVRDGYARNYLLPQKLAVLADPSNLKQLAHEQKVVAAQQSKLKGEAQRFAQRLAKAELRFQRDVGEEGKLFGSVTAQDIVDALAKQDLLIERRRIRLGAPLKALGQFPIEIKLHAAVTVPLTITVESTATPEEVTPSE